MVELLVLLPSHLLCRVFFVWLHDWKYIGNMDTAVCNRILRPHFLQTIEIMGTEMPMPTVSSEILLIQWILARKVKVRDVRFSLPFVQQADVQRRFLEAVGASITRLYINVTSQNKEPDWGALYWQISLHCPNLQGLYLEGVAVTAAVGVVFLQCTKLSQFQCHLIDNTSLCQLLHTCRRLLLLEVTAQVIERPLHSSFRCLRALILPQTHIPAQDLVTHFPMLEVLFIKGVSSADLATIINGFPSMISFSANSSYIQDDCVSLLIQGWRDLRSLLLKASVGTNSNLFCDAKLLELVEGCPKLERLLVGGNHSSSSTNGKWESNTWDSTAAPVTEGKHALQMLFVYTLAPATMHAILTRCPALNYLSTYDARGPIFDVIARSHVQNLRFLNLNSSQVASLSGLRTLECCYARSAEKSCDGMIAMAKRSPRLHALVVYESGELVSKLHLVVTHLPLLRELVVHQLQGVGQKEVSHKEMLLGLLKIACPKLVKIDIR